MAWGQYRTVADWAADARCSVDYVTILQRIDRGWSPEETVSTPSLRRYELTAWGETKRLPAWLSDARLQMGWHPAARGKDDANRRPQRHERVPPGSPKGVAGDGALARSGLKWRLQPIPRWGNTKQIDRLPAQPLRPQADLKHNVTPDAPRRRCWPTRAVEAGRDQSGQPGPIA
jgi:hypothetical protein